MCAFRIKFPGNSSLLFGVQKVSIGSGNGLAQQDPIY